MPRGEWTFVTTHGAVLALIASRGQITAKDIADTLGITERPVRRVIAELEGAGYLRKQRNGRANHYEVNQDLPLRLHALRDTAVGELIRVLKFSKSEQPRDGALGNQRGSAAATSRESTDPN